MANGSRHRSDKIHRAPRAENAARAARAECMECAATDAFTVTTTGTLTATLTTTATGTVTTTAAAPATVTVTFTTTCPWRRRQPLARSRSHAQLTVAGASMIAADATRPAPRRQGLLVSVFMNKFSPGDDARRSPRASQCASAVSRFSWNAASSARSFTVSQPRLPF